MNDIYIYIQRKYKYIATCTVYTQYSHLLCIQCTCHAERYTYMHTCMHVLYMLTDSSVSGTNRMIRMVHPCRPFVFTNLPHIS